MINFKPLTFANVKIKSAIQNERVVLIMVYKELCTEVQDNHGSRVLGLNRLNKMIREIIQDRVINEDNDICEVRRV